MRPIFNSASIVTAILLALGVCEQRLPQTAFAAEPRPTTESMMARLNGTWHFESCERFGAEVREKWNLVFTDSELGVYETDGRLVYTTEYRIDVGQDPVAFDILRTNPRNKMEREIVMYGIMKIEGDRLTRCMRRDTRPKSFDVEKERAAIVTIHRRATDKK